MYETARVMLLEGAEVTFLDVDKNGLIDINQFTDSIKENTVFASVMLANNETGVIQPVKEIADICHLNGILFHTDATQGTW